MKLIFSSVFETDFAAGVEYLAREANEEVASRWEVSVYRTIELLQKIPCLGVSGATCSRRAFALMG